MIPSKSRRGFLLVAIAGACLLPSASRAAITVVGTGPDSSYLVLESPNLGVRTYEIRYTYNPGSSQDAWFLFSQVVNSDASYVVTKSNYGSPSAPNYFIDSINGESSTFIAPYLYWAQWVAGGSGFQNPDFSYNSGAVPAGSWSIGYGVSTHFIEPGSWDALVYSEGSTEPSVAPVPETSSLLLAVAGLVVVAVRRRKV